MDGKLLVNSLISLRGSNLRIMYALLLKTNISDFLSSKAKGVLTKEGNEYSYKRINDEVRQLENIPDSILQVELFLEITKILKLKGRNYSVQEQLEEQCTIIINQIYEIQRKQDLAFRALNVRYAKLSQLQQLVIYYINNFFKEFDDKFKGFPLEQQLKFSNEIHVLINSHTDRNQEKIKSLLGEKDLTNEAIREFIISHGIRNIFIIIVEMKGFHYYFDAMALVTAYLSQNNENTISSSNNVFMLGICSTVAGITYHNNTSKKKILPTIIVQICLPYMFNNNHRIDITSFIQEWEKRLLHYIEVKDRLKNVTYKVNEVTRSVNKIEDLIQDYNRKISDGWDKIHNRKQVIKLALIENMEDLEINQTFQRHKQNYYSICDRIVGLRREKQRDKSFNIIKRIGKQFRNIPVILDIRALEKQRKLSMDILVEDLLHSNTSFMEEEKMAIEMIENEINKWGEKVKFAKEKKRSKEMMLKDLKQNLNNCIQQCKRLEKKNHGLRDLYINTSDLSKV